MSSKDQEKLPTNPREFPDDRVPNFILKAKNGHFHFMMVEPDVSKNYLWYMSEPKLVTIPELEVEMRIPGRRWYATDRPGFELQKKNNALATEGEPYVCLHNIKNRDLYYFGRRHAEPPVEKVTLVVSVAELYLKSAIHRKRLVRVLMDNIRRVLKNPQVFRNGDTMIEIRKEVPTEEQLRVLALLPGIAKIYRGLEGEEERKGDPRGQYICDGAQGIPITPDQRVLALLSGGIDSPVAAYRMMTRGCLVSGIHFLNSTNDTASVVEKNRRICERLSSIQGRFDMHYVDISALQSQIVANVPNHNRTLIYKWFMLSLAAAFDDSLFIVTGDSAGQVASQTVHNISTLYPSIRKGVVAPLIGMPKNYIIEEARKIQTFDLSIQEGADCCQYMMCKTGANLMMGRRTLEACVRCVKLKELKVTKDIYRDGHLCESSEFTYLPESGLRKSSDNPSVSACSPDASPADSLDDVVYFDAAAGTKMPEQVKTAMLRAPEGNPNSLHMSGREARMAMEKVRTQLAKVLHVPANDIIFTAGGTESNNIALNGYHVVREAWSHASMSGSHNVPAGATIVKAVDLVNHETGSVNRDLTRPPGGRLHVDASQALLKVDFSTLDLSEVDSITVSAHKVNGPVGIGAVYLRGSSCNRLYGGGSQEKGIRPGTENVPAIVGFGVALGLDRSHSIHKEIDALMVEELEKMGCEVNRRGEVSGFIVHATLPEGYRNTDVVSRLSTKYHVEIGTGSACKTNEVNTTVYDTLGKKPAPTRSIRISWDSFATLNDAERVISAMKNVLDEMKPKK
ncbi:thiamine biosynthesis-like protein [Leptomonas seymouri]|uniref:Thiamine biosynthesis-like protein n=1 Tax=Leptomonas seymouri TaxID=5684 RepID=A0A0N1IM59_LEPSE|nr:thiamine biosynthesis-like protein [Leptomonas seymouri]|eukprot:KPI89524.1 thiamine biosynthesis-like protein [Leptomonas seymouri]